MKTVKFASAKPDFFLDHIETGSSGPTVIESEEER
jgi:hypothetical protein